MQNRIQTDVDVDAGVSWPLGWTETLFYETRASRMSFIKKIELP